MSGPGRTFPKRSCQVAEHAPTTFVLSQEGPALTNLRSTAVVVAPAAEWCAAVHRGRGLARTSPQVWRVLSVDRIRLRAQRLVGNGGGRTSVRPMRDGRLGRLATSIVELGRGGWEPSTPFQCPERRSVYSTLVECRLRAATASRKAATSSSVSWSRFWHNEQSSGCTSTGAASTSDSLSRAYSSSSPSESGRPPHPAGALPEYRRSACQCQPRTSRSCSE